MIAFPDRGNTVYFDCDDTLVMWGFEQLPQYQSDLVFFDDPYRKGVKIALVPHLKHIQKVKSHKSGGCVVVVWSAGGAQWAEEVVMKLGLADYVDVCLSKPFKYFDDLHCTDFMGRRTYYPFKQKDPSQ